LDGPIESVCADLEQVWKQARRGASEKAIHNLRVSTRKMDALLEILPALNDDSDIQKLRRRLKKVKRAVGPLRDIDVQIRLALGSKSVGDTRKFILHMRSKKAKERKVALKVLNVADRKKFSKEHRRIRKRALADLRKSDVATARKSVRMLIQAAQQEFKLAQKDFRSDDAKKLHALRIAARKLRFLVEAASSIFPRLSNISQTALRECQSKMGELRDRQLLHKTITEWREDE